MLLIFQNHIIIQQAIQQAKELFYMFDRYIYVCSCSHTTALAKIL